MGWSRGCFGLSWYKCVSSLSSASDESGLHESSSPSELAPLLVRFLLLSAPTGAGGYALGSAINMMNNMMKGTFWNDGYTDWLKGVVVMCLDTQINAQQTDILIDRQIDRQLYLPVFISRESVVLAGDDDVAGPPLRLMRLECPPAMPVTSEERD